MYEDVSLCVSNVLSFPLTVGPFQHVYCVVCKQLGEQLLTVSIGNGPTIKNQFTANETTCSCNVGPRYLVKPQMTWLCGIVIGDW